jgi:hypothetical protein
LLRAFAWARLALAGALLVTVPLTASDFAPVAGGVVLPLALGVAVASSAAVLLRRVTPRPRRVAALLSTLDVVLITAVVASTGGSRSMYSFLYVLTATGACVLLSRAGAVAVAASASVLYAGLVLARTLVPITYFFEAPYETSALEVTTMCLNAATLLVIAGRIARSSDASTTCATSRRSATWSSTAWGPVWSCSIASTGSPPSTGPPPRSPVAERR